MTYLASLSNAQGHTNIHYTAQTLIDMLAYKRPQGSRYQRKFCRRFLEPVFGKPDAHGNYTLVVGGKDARVAFMAHHDTVHHADGKQLITFEGDIIKTAGNDCLGADCTTGVYIMLCMIAAGVAGVYVVHAAEEVGCVGSSALVKDYPMWISQVDAAISFDRKGYDNLITHQMGMRCCSDEFADSLADIIELGYKKDASGVYTDSNEYVGVIAECTNISVGYFNQHTKNESQDLAFVEILIDSLIKADWSKLVIKRVAGETEYDTSMYSVDKSRTRGWPTMDYYDDDYHKTSKADFSYKGEPSMMELDSLVSVIKRYPEQVAEILATYGYSADGLIDDCVDIKEKWNRKYRY